MKILKAIYIIIFIFILNYTITKPNNFQILKDNENKSNNLIQLNSFVKKQIITTRYIEKTIKYQGTEILNYKLTYPYFNNNEFLNCYYTKKVDSLRLYYENTLIKDAINLYKEALINDFPFHKYEIVLNYKISLNSNNLISLYFDKYEYTGGAHGITVRNSDTWDITSQNKYELSNLFPKDFDYKNYLLDNIQNIAAKDQSIYFENYLDLVKENFNKNNYFLTEKNIIIYYQLYSIAPYSSGIREFIIPLLCDM